MTRTAISSAAGPGCLAAEEAGAYRVPGSVHGRSRLVRAADLLDQLMAARGPRRVLLHDLAEEPSDVLQPCVLCIADVLAVVVPGLERVILNRDQVERHVIEAGFSGSHRWLPSLIGCPRCYPASARETGRRPPRGDDSGGARM